MFLFQRWKYIDKRNRHIKSNILIFVSKKQDLSFVFILNSDENYGKSINGYL